MSGMTEADEAQLTYAVRFQLPDGGEERVDSYKTRHIRRVDDFVNLPIGPEGAAHAGKGYIWRVKAIEADGPTLVLVFERPHGDTEDSGQTRI